MYTEYEGVGLYIYHTCIGHFLMGEGHVKVPTIDLLTFPTSRLHCHQVPLICSESFPKVSKFRQT